MLQGFFVLDYQDSNLDKQNQNLLCYHYTIVQSSALSLESGAKIRVLFYIFQTFRRKISIVTEKNYLC